MSREVDLDPTLLEWLVRPDHDPVESWEPEPALDELLCHPDLVARLAQVARPVGAARRRFVAGCPVIHHPRGRPIAAAAGTSVLIVHSGLPPGALATSTSLPPQLDTDWVDLDPWAVDVAFARVVDLLRGHVVRAYDEAESHP